VAEGYCGARFGAGSRAIPKRVAQKSDEGGCHQVAFVAFELILHAFRHNSVDSEYIDSERLDVEQLDLVRITSLSPHDAFVAKPSWRVEVGYQTLRDLDCGRCHWFKVAGGTGRAVRLKRSVSSLAYAFFNLEAGLSEAFDASFRLAPGVMAGVMFQPFHFWKVHVSGSVYYPVLGGGPVYYRNLVHQHIAFTRQIGVRLEMNYFKTTLEGLVALHIYF
jgi:hypothetical protein